MLSGFDAHDVLWQIKAGRQRRQRTWPWEGWVPDIMLTPKFSFFSLRQHSKKHVPQPGYALCKIFATLGLYLGHLSLCCVCLVLADRKAREENAGTYSPWFTARKSAGICPGTSTKTFTIMLQKYNPKAAKPFVYKMVGCTDTHKKL